MKSPFVNLPDGFAQLPKKPVRLQLEPLEALLLYTMLSDACETIERQPPGVHRDSALASFESVRDKLFDKLDFAFS